MRELVSIYGGGRWSEVDPPPDIRKNIQAFTVRLKPKAKLIYSSTLVFGTWLSFALEPAASALATWVAEKAKKRKQKVPTNSPDPAMKWFRILFGRKPMNGNRSSFLFGSLGLRFMPGKLKPFEDVLRLSILTVVAKTNYVRMS